MAGSGQIVVIKRDGTDGPAYPVTRGSIKIGGDKVCDIRIPVKGLSPTQCTITVNSNNATIRNLSSKASTLVNSVSITTKVLGHGDILTFNVGQFRWDYTQQRPNSPAVSMRKSKGNSGQPKFVVKKGRKSIGKRKSFPTTKKTESHIKKLISGRNSLDALLGKSRQVAVVKPQRREDQWNSISASGGPTPDVSSTTRVALNSPKGTPVRNRTNTPSTGKKQQAKRVSTNLVSADVDSSLITNKRRRINDIEKVDTPVIIDKNKRAALMLLTGKSPKSRGTPAKNATNNIVGQNIGDVNIRATPVKETPPKTQRSMIKATPSNLQKEAIASPIKGRGSAVAKVTDTPVVSPRKFKVAETVLQVTPLKDHVQLVSVSVQKITRSTPTFQRQTKATPATESRVKTKPVNTKSLSVSKLPLKSASKIIPLKSVTQSKIAGFTRRSIGKPVLSKQRISRNSVINTPTSLLTVKSPAKSKDNKPKPPVRETPKQAVKATPKVYNSVNVPTSARSVRKTPSIRNTSVRNQAATKSTQKRSVTKQQSPRKAAGSKSIIPRKILAINPKTFYKRTSPKKQYLNKQKVTSTSQSKSPKVISPVKIITFKVMSPVSKVMAKTPARIGKKSLVISSSKSATASPLVSRSSNRNITPRVKSPKKQSVVALLSPESVKSLTTPKSILSPRGQTPRSIKGITKSPRRTVVLTPKSANILAAQSLRKSVVPSPKIAISGTPSKSPRRSVGSTPKSAKITTSVAPGPKISAVLGTLPKTRRSVVPTPKSTKVTKAETPKSAKSVVSIPKIVVVSGTPSRKSTRSVVPTPKAAKIMKAQTPKLPRSVASSPKFAVVYGTTTPKSPKSVVPTPKSANILKVQSSKSTKRSVVLSPGITAVSATPSPKSTRRSALPTPNSVKVLNAQTPRWSAVSSPRSAKVGKALTPILPRSSVTPKSPRSAEVKKVATPKSARNSVVPTPKSTKMSTAQTPKSPKKSLALSPKSTKASKSSETSKVASIFSKALKVQTPKSRGSRSPKSSRKSPSHVIISASKGRTPRFVVTSKSPKVVLTPKLHIHDVLNASIDTNRRKSRISPLKSPEKYDSSQKRLSAKVTPTPRKSRSVKFHEFSGDLSEYESFSQSSVFISPRNSSKVSKATSVETTSSITPRSQRASSKSPRGVAGSSPIVSPKQSSPRTPDSLPIPDGDINATPNLSILFDLEASTPKDIQKCRSSRSSIRKSLIVTASPRGIKKSSNLVRNVKTEPRKKPSAADKTNILTRGNRSVDQLSSSSDATDVTAPQPENEIVITPKSMVKLIPEHLREKHSTAKKSISRKAMIDHLTASPEIAKELFKSPVKRKLSQSIRIYNTSIAQDDINDASIVSAARDVSFEFSMNRQSRSPRNSRKSSSSFKSARDTPVSLDFYASPVGKNSGLSKRKSSTSLQKGKSKTPLHAVAEKSKQIHKKSKIVDKVKTLVKNDLTNVVGVRRSMRPARSPKSDLTNVKGVKKNVSTPRFTKSPKNDLTNISGVKNLMKTPQTQKSARNDLTSVRGLKKIFITPKVVKSPKNDLTNVKGVKKILGTPRPAKSPKNDLTNVSGVRSLLRTPRGQKSPRNDLTNVEGVSKMFKSPAIGKSPKNDLSDVRGVRNLLRTPRKQKSPKNDLRNVAGVKNIMQIRGIWSPKNSFENVSGIRGLFESSNMSENLFDSLTGRSPVKTYSKKPSISSASPANVSKASHLVPTDDTSKTPGKRGKTRKKQVATPTKAKILREGIKSPSQKDRTPIQKFNNTPDINNLSNVRSRRQITIEKTNFSMEVSKVELNKRPTNASILGQSTPAKSKKAAVNMSEINIKLLSPILSAPKGESPKSASPSKGKRSVKVSSTKKDTRGSTKATAPVNKRGKRKLELAPDSQESASVGRRRGRKVASVPTNVSQDSQLEKSLDKKKKVTFASDVTKVADDRPTKARNTRSRSAVGTAVTLAVTRKIKTSPKEESTRVSSARGRKRAAPEPIVPVDRVKKSKKSGKDKSPVMSLTVSAAKTPKSARKAKKVPEAKATEKINKTTEKTKKSPKVASLENVKSPKIKRTTRATMSDKAKSPEKVKRVSKKVPETVQKIKTPDEPQKAASKKTTKSVSKKTSKVVSPKKTARPSPKKVVKLSPNKSVKKTPSKRVASKTVGAKKVDSKKSGKAKKVAKKK